jgi:heme exporter protein D
MIWNSWNAFLSMGGYAWYVWGSVAAVIAALAGEVVALRLRRRGALRAIVSARGRGRRS